MLRNAHHFVLATAISLVVTGIQLTHISVGLAGQDNVVVPLRLGIIGLDTSHSIAFTKLLNDENVPQELAGCKVVAAYPYGSRDIESSASRIPKYTEEIRALGVEVVDSIERLLEQVDGVLLETNDGRLHLEQARLVIRAQKPMFIDKPVAASLADVVAIYQEAEAANVPVWSSSSLRYMPGIAAVRAGEAGEIRGCDTFSPCALEQTHPDLFWYGIHGVETLFAVMGTGCESVVRVSSDGADVVVGKWSSGRIGTFRGTRDAQGGYGGTVFGTKATKTLGPYDGYGPLVREIVQFFRTKKVPVSAEETIELYAFMAAADESKRLGGQPVNLREFLQAQSKGAGQ